MQCLIKAATILILVDAISGSRYNVLQRDWIEWKALHGKSYSVEEERWRFGVWEKNFARIVQHNEEVDRGIYSYKMEMNVFGDLDEGMRVNEMQPLGIAICNDTMYDSNFISMVDLPESVDWRKEGAVTPVQNQGSLGQSWTYSATGALEGQNFLKSGKLIKLSEENLADCATSDFSSYCVTGSPECAFYYVDKNGGIDSEEGYPKLHDGQCHYDPTKVSGTCSGCFNVPSQNEKSLQKALATVGPVSAFIDASRSSFQLYKSGIYDDPKCRGDHLDHAILIVGYGTDNGKDFWIARNSWGSLWGEQGYVRIARNHGNLCGIATRASYPVV